MKKKIGLILGGIFLFSLVLVGVVFAATSVESPFGATVTINEFLDITLAEGGDGFNFGSLDPGATNIPDDDQVDGDTSTTSAVIVTRQATSNVDVEIRLKGDDFTVGGGDTLPVTNVAYDDDGEVDVTGVDEIGLTQETMSTTYPTGSGTNDPWATLTSVDQSVKIWFWLDVPSGQEAGT